MSVVAEAPVESMIQPTTDTSTDIRTDVKEPEESPKEGNRRIREIPGPYTHDIVSELFTKDRWVLDGECISEIYGMDSDWSTYTAYTREIYKRGLRVATGDWTEYDDYPNKYSDDEDDVGF